MLRSVRSWGTMAVVAAACLAPARVAQARDVYGLVRMTFDFGGDTLSEVTWSDGKTGTIKAGELFGFVGGALWAPEGRSWAVEGTLGYKVDRANGANGSVLFSRLPLEVLGFYLIGNHRIGAGPTYHIAPRYSCDLEGYCNSSVSYGGALGLVAEYAYTLRMPSMLVEGGLRFTLIKYAADGFPDVSGTGGGFFFGVGF